MCINFGQNNCINYGQYYCQQAAMQGGGQAPPPPPPPQQPNVSSGNLAVDNINEISIKNNIESVGVSEVKDSTKIQSFNPSQSYIKLGTERALGLFSQQPQFKAVNEYNKFMISQTAYKKL